MLCGVCDRSCSCNVYQHYGFCQEVCLWALDQGLFTRIPPTLDPRKVHGKRGGEGRTAKAVAGKPLEMEAGKKRKQPAKAPSSKAKAALPTAGSVYRSRRIIADDDESD